MAHLFNQLAHSSHT